jgi:hypothetical protein
MLIHAYNCSGLKKENLKIIDGDVELSAHYVICKDGRTITQEVCQADYIYSPVSRTCIQVNKGKIEFIISPCFIKKENLKIIDGLPWCNINKILTALVCKLSYWNVISSFNKIRYDWRINFL